MHPICQKLVARRLILVMVLPVASFLSGCSSTFPWFQRDHMPEMAMLPPEPEMMPEEPAPAEMASLEPASLMPPTPPAMTRPARPRVASNRRPPPPRDSHLAKEPPKEPPPPGPAPSTLVGFDFVGVLKVLRKPDSTQNSALSNVWTYSDADCTLQLYFYPDIETKTFHLLKYDLKNSDGEKLEDTGACMQQFVAMRNDGVQ